jgi:hypothetical protein
MAFKMKGHTLPGIKQLKSNDNEDGRSGSAAFQQSDDPFAGSSKDDGLRELDIIEASPLPEPMEYDFSKKFKEKTGGPFDQKKKDKVTKFLGRERTVHYDDDGTKTVITRKKPKDGEVEYTRKTKFTGKDGKKVKVKGKGTYDVETGGDITYKEKMKRGRRGDWKITDDYTNPDLKNV